MEEGKLKQSAHVATTKQHQITAYHHQYTSPAQKDDNLNDRVHDMGLYLSDPMSCSEGFCVLGELPT